MRMLVTWGSKRGGTEGIGQAIAEALDAQHIDVIAKPARELKRIQPGAFDGVIVGGALYANRWHKDARRFVDRNADTLRSLPVWFFSSGPLDDSADKSAIPPPDQVAVRMERVGVVAHETFGGRLEAHAQGFPATAMAQKHAGDWRNPDRIRAWARDIARALPTAAPKAFVQHPARALPRLVAHGVLGWAACAVVLAALVLLTSTKVAIALYAVAAPLVFVGVAVHYFRARGARDPLPTALWFTAIVAVLDAFVAAVVLHDFTMFTSLASLAGTWLPLALVFFTTWATGAMMAMMPAIPQKGGRHGRHQAIPATHR